MHRWVSNKAKLATRFINLKIFKDLGFFKIYRDFKDLWRFFEIYIQIYIQIYIFFFQEFKIFGCRDFSRFQGFFKILKIFCFSTSII